jgi:putative ribosome biogenesis GTPase RsgA
MQNYILDESDDFLPSYYVEMPSGFTSIGGIDFLSIPEISAKAVERYFKLMTDQSIVMIGQSEVDASSLISTIMPHQFYVAKGNNG